MKTKNVSKKSDSNFQVDTVSTIGSPASEKSFNVKSRFKSKKMNDKSRELATPKVEKREKRSKIKPNVLTLPSIKLQTSRKFWENNKSISHQSFCGYGANDKSITLTKRRDTLNELIRKSIRQQGPQEELVV